MSKYLNEIKPISCYHCSHCIMINKDKEDEWWGCDEEYGIPVGVNPPYDEICEEFQRREDEQTKIK